MRFIPSRAAIVAALSAAFIALISLARRDARQDLQSDLKQDDFDHAKGIETRLSVDRADPNRMRTHTHRGYRD